MSITTEKRGYRLRIQRQLSADAATVFDAWTTTESMKKWMCPGPGMTTPKAELDVRVGGEYTLVMASPEAEYEHHGTYLEVDPPRLLSFTWISSSGSGRSSRKCSRPFTRRSTSPAPSRTLMCLDTAVRDMENGSASLVTRTGPEVSWARIALRVGSAMALNGSL